MPSPQELDIVERFLGTFPEDLGDRAQTIGVVRVLFNSNSISARQIVEELDRNGGYQPTISCDENGGTPREGDVVFTLTRMADSGFVTRDGDNWSFTLQGRQAISEYDKRCGFGEDQ